MYNLKGEIMEMYLWIFIMFVIGYLFGSINWGLAIGKIFYKKDIRLEGSKNAGATNAGRVLGKKVFFIVALLDILKGVIAFLLGWLVINISGYEFVNDFEFKLSLLPQIAAFSSFIGHLFPVFFKFKGGKGVTTCFATNACIAPITALILIGFWAVMLIATKLMGLASVLALVFYPIVLWLFGAEFDSIEITFQAKIIGTAVCSISIFKHRANIVRLIKRQEKRLSFGK